MFQDSLHIAPATQQIATAPKAEAAKPMTNTTEAIAKTAMPKETATLQNPAENKQKDTFFHFFKDSPAQDSTSVNPQDELAMDTIATETAPQISYIDQHSIDSVIQANTLGFLTGKFDFSHYNPLTDKHFHTAQPGISGTPIPYKLSNDIFVTSTLLVCLFIACFVVTRSMHALFLQVKNFFFNRDRNESTSLKSESELKNQLFVVLLESFVLSLLFFSYSEFQNGDHFIHTSPYLILLVDMGICLLYFVLKYAAYNMFNWAFFNSENRELWTTSYNLIMLAKAVLLLPLVLIVLYFDLQPIVCIWAFAGLLIVLELLILYKTWQIFFATPAGFLASIWYFCTLELIPLIALVGVLVKTNEILIA